MEKRQGLVPLAVLLGALAALLIGSRFMGTAGVSFLLTLPIPAIPLWLTWEFAADVVTVFGFPLAIATLWYSTRDLRRRPTIVLGFPLKENPEVRDRKLSRRFVPSGDSSYGGYGRVFTLRVSNAGGRTARNVVVVLSINLSEGQLIPYRAGKNLFNGGLQLSLVETIHPGSDIEQEFELHVQQARLRHDFEVSAVASFDDETPVRQTLFIGIGVEGQNSVERWPVVRHPNPDL